MASNYQASSVNQPDRREEEPQVREEEFTWSSTLAMLKTAPKEKPPAIIDERCPLSIVVDAQVYKDYDCTLNRTNISANNNKFIIIQLLKYKGFYGVWKHAGRVGYEGQSKPVKWKSKDAAKDDFKQLFEMKTENSWDTRQNFDAQTGKYKLIEVEREVNLTQAGGGGHPQDVKMMPLGKLSKQQIARGFEALEELEAALKPPAQAAHLEDLSSHFYTIIPHDFAKDKPPIIDSLDLLRSEKDMLLMLAKNVLAQSLQAQEMEEEEEENEVPHPLDQDYSLLCSQLSQLKSNDEIQQESGAQDTAQEGSGCS